MRCMDFTPGVKLGRKIKELRKKQGITQEELAERVKTSYKYIQRIEGRTPPDVRLTTIIRLARVLKTPPYELLKF